MSLLKNPAKKISYSVFTDPGNREINEDSVGVFKKNKDYCFVLCDGLGGHGMGDIASSLAVKVIGSQFENQHDNKIFLKDAIPSAHSIILTEQIQKKASGKMKTTAVVAVISDGKINMIHIGDSRGYIFDKKNSYQRTLDHSVPQMMVISKQIKEEEIRNHPDRSVVLKAIGANIDTNIQFDSMKPINENKVRALLLSSDGFWELITEDKMILHLNESRSAEEWLQRMVTDVREQGKDIDMDNFSAIAVWIE